MSDPSYDGNDPQADAGDETMLFFDCLLNADEHMRAFGIEDVSRKLTASLTDDAAHSLFLVHLPGLVQLATACPFPDVRVACKRLVDSASAYLSESELGVARAAPRICLYLPADSIPTVAWPTPLRVGSSSSLNQLDLSASALDQNSDASAPAAAGESDGSESMLYPICLECGQRHAPSDATDSAAVAAAAAETTEAVTTPPLPSSSPPAAPRPSPLADALASLSARPPAPSEIRPLFEDLFLTVGRVSHLDQVLALLPEFFVPAANTLHFIMRENGPLPLPWRNYLAILASSRFRCDSLMSLQRREFLVNGGDEQWLAGVAHAPQKIQNLLELNARLAHQPWTINRENLAKLLKGTDAWSVAELVHAIVLLSTFHYLSCVSHGVGVTTEQDLVWTPHASFFSGTACGYAASAISAAAGDAVASSAAADSALSEEGSSSTAPAVPSSVDVSEPSGAASTAAAAAKSSRKSVSEYGSPSMSGCKQNTQQLARLLTTDLETLVADASQSVDPASVPIRIIPVTVAAPGPEPVDGAKDASPSYLSPVAEFIPGRSATASDGANPSIVPLPRSSSSGNNLASLAAGSGGASKISPVSSVLGLSSLVPPAAAAAPSAVVASVSALAVPAAAFAECPTAASAEAALVFLVPSPLATMQYETYDIKAFTALHEEEYSWKEHGFALVNRFYKGVAPLLDAELDLIYEFTENNLGSGQDQLDNVDTGPFRRAIWYYAHRIFGMTAGDVDYKMVNIFLSRPLKAFVKRVTCFPDSIGAAEFEEALGTYSFRPSEKLHIVLLAAEGRRQACLLHALHAVMEHMTC